MMTEFSIMGKSLCVELYFFFFYTTNTLESLPNMVTVSLIMILILIPIKSDGIMSQVSEMVSY